MNTINGVKGQGPELDEPNPHWKKDVEIIDTSLTVATATLPHFTFEETK